MSFRPRALARLVSVMLIAAALTPLLVPAVARAQTRQPAPLAGGDIAWAFANENPLSDSRLSGALGTAMTSSVEAGAPAGMRIVRVEAEGPDLVPATIYPGADVPLLLAASGFGSTPPFVVAGACRVWSASPAAAGVAPVLEGALIKALAGLEVNVDRCITTTNAAEAHLLVWEHGTDTAPALPQRDTPTFLAPNLAAPQPGAQPGQQPSPGGMGGGFPRPAVTGTGGPEAPRDAAPVLLLAFGAMMVLGGRRITRRA